MGVHRLALRHQLLPSDYRPASYFHDACFHCAPVKVQRPPHKHTGTLLFLVQVNPKKAPELKSDEDFSVTVSCWVSTCFAPHKHVMSDE